MGRTFHPEQLEDSGVKVTNDRGKAHPWRPTRL
jgi:hypothetical protein